MGGGKKGNDGSKAPNVSSFDKDYANRYPDVAASGMNSYYHFLTYGQNEGRTYGEAPKSSSAGFEAPFKGIMDSMAKQQAQMKAEADAANAAYAEQQRVAQGTAYLDQLFSTKLDAATRAASEVDKQITDELAHASVKGIDYAITPEEKQTRINNMFGDYWSESQEADFSTYAKDFGSTRHQWKLATVRGSGAGSSGALAPEVKVGGKVQKGAGTVLTGDEEEEEQESTTLLGG